MGLQDKVDAGITAFAFMDVDGMPGTEEVTLTLRDKTTTRTVYAQVDRSPAATPSEITNGKTAKLWLAFANSATAGLTPDELDAGWTVTVTGFDKPMALPMKPTKYDAGCVEFRIGGN